MAQATVGVVSFSIIFLCLILAGLIGVLFGALSTYWNYEVAIQTMRQLIPLYLFVSVTGALIWTFIVHK